MGLGAAVPRHKAVVLARIHSVNASVVADDFAEIALALEEHEPIQVRLRHYQSFIRFNLDTNKPRWERPRTHAFHIETAVLVSEFAQCQFSHVVLEKHHEPAQRETAA